MLLFLEILLERMIGIAISLGKKPVRPQHRQDDQAVQYAESDDNRPEDQEPHPCGERNVLVTPVTKT